MVVNHIRLARLLPVDHRQVRQSSTEPVLRILRRHRDLHQVADFFMDVTNRLFLLRSSVRTMPGLLDVHRR